MSLYNTALSVPGRETKALLLTAGEERAAHYSAPPSDGFILRPSTWGSSEEEKEGARRVMVPPER